MAQNDPDGSMAFIWAHLGHLWLHSLRPSVEKKNPGAGPGLKFACDLGEAYFVRSGCRLGGVSRVAEVFVAFGAGVVGVVSVSLLIELVARVR
jgi:hypothetical protein